MTTSPDLKFMLSHPAHVLALGFGTGLTKHAPGTAGTLIGFPLFAAMMWLPQPTHWPLLCVLFLAGIYLCHTTGRALGVADHGSIVWDEIVAMMLVLEFTPRAWLWWLMAFLLFRLFDIWKPFPIRQCDARLKGGFGVMFDDLLAAIYAILSLQALLWLTTRFPG